MPALRLLDGHFAVARLPSDAPIPHWAAHGPFVSITRTEEELSIVTRDSAVPHDVHAERGWRCLALAGPIPFDVTGVAASLTMPLAAASISLFLVSTYDTDYLLVKDAVLEQAVDVLKLNGFSVTVGEPSK
jgi:hypothetical protein